MLEILQAMAAAGTAALVKVVATEAFARYRGRPRQGPERPPNGAER